MPGGGPQGFVHEVPHLRLDAAPVSLTRCLLFLPQIRLPPEVNRILYIRNLPYKITAEEMYDIFGKYGPIRQIRVGNTPETRGTAYVVYEDIFDAKNACDHLSGFNVCNRYLVVLYYNANRAFQKMDTKKKEEQLKLLKEKYGINTDPPK
nr:splicing factor 3B subunit 6 [Dromaius novaehollandiae]